jgi:hypothetical protein
MTWRWPKIVSVTTRGKRHFLTLACGHEIQPELLKQYIDHPDQLLGKSHDCPHGCQDEPKEAA